MEVQDFANEYVSQSARLCFSGRSAIPTKAQVRSELRSAFPLIGWLKLAYWTWWIISEIRKRLKETR